jgi:exo-beta-1,3-glucanase (GH17 family)
MTATSSIGVLFLTLLCAWGASTRPTPSPSDAPIDRRAFDASSNGHWLGAGICYGPHRDGQSPGVNDPSESEILEDLRIMSRHWPMIRVYASRGSAGIICRLVRAEKLPLRVMVGAWIAPEYRETDGKREELPDAVANNAAEIAEAIRLANEFPDVVLALGVGNETQVTWSSHRSSRDRLVAAIREVRQATKQPVTTCDDFAFWTSDESAPVAAECDFIAAHLYAMWNKQQLPDALDWTRDRLAEIEKRYPGIPVVVTEIGWATKRGTEGYQAIGIVGTPGEGEQELFYRSLRDWATQRRLPYFYFEAFDEKWKGGPSPDEVEKHWGVFNSDRTPKRVIRGEPTAEVK